uniref:Uncharacterized protein n=1 Tax=Micrurus lemniscatus lemniscatus TaxID=129467 RepID=A0A2D4HYQ1_MICLE
MFLQLVKLTGIICASKIRKYMQKPIICTYFGTEAIICSWETSTCYNNYIAFLQNKMCAIPNYSVLEIYRLVIWHNFTIFLSLWSPRLNQIISYGTKEKIIRDKCCLLTPRYMEFIIEL